MKTKIISLILCFAMCIGLLSSLTACSGSNSDSFVIMTEQLDGLFNPFFYTFIFYTSLCFFATKNK
mgnify:CR=1 FL=1